MNRREFAKATGIAAFACSAIAREALAGPGEATANAFDSIDPIYGRLVKVNDSHVPQCLERQQLSDSHRWFGGFSDEHGIFFAGVTSNYLAELACAYSASESVYYRSDELLKRMQMAVGSLRRMQHDDGTIDCSVTNFHSPPDTAFTMEYLCAVYVVLQRHGSEAVAKLLDGLREFIVKGGDALTTGGIHTPNHRWGVCMALARANSLFPHPQYVARIDEWLHEKIDIDPDGQFSERSTSAYSPWTDRWLLTVARLLDRPDLYEPVRRNLEMTMYYVHPDGEVATEASRRYDQYSRGPMTNYYYPYRYMALLDRDGRFAAMARRIEQTTALQPLSCFSPNLLLDFMESPSYGRAMPESVPPPTDYAKVYSHSQLARLRRGDISATILACNPTFFTFRQGKAVLESLRFASAFFGKGQFEGEALETNGAGYVLRQNLEACYYQPLSDDRLPGDGDWARMDLSLRPKSNRQKLQAVATISELKGRFLIAIDIRGTDDVPVAVELAFRHGGQLKGVEKVPGVDHAYLLPSGIGQYACDGDVISFGPGRAEHAWTQLRARCRKPMPCPCI